jgi:uncharacterized protein YuzE
MTDTTYDPVADAVYFHVGRGDIGSTEEVAPGVMFDYDANGHIVGIEVTSASKVLAPGAWMKTRRPGEARVDAAE